MSVISGESTLGEVAGPGQPSSGRAHEQRPASAVPGPPAGGPAVAKRFLLRLDPRLFDALRRWAGDDMRSINAQIEYLLTDQARRAGRLPDPRRTRSSPETGMPPDSDKADAPLAPTGSLAQG